MLYYRIMNHQWGKWMFVWPKRRRKFSIFGFLSNTTTTTTTTTTKREENRNRIDLYIYIYWDDIVNNMFASCKSTQHISNNGTIIRQVLLFSSSYCWFLFRYIVISLALSLSLSLFLSNSINLIIISVIKFIIFCLLCVLFLSPFG